MFITIKMVLCLDRSLLFFYDSSSQEILLKCHKTNIFILDHVQSYYNDNFKILQDCFSQLAKFSLNGKKLGGLNLFLNHSSTIFIIKWC